MTWELVKNLGHVKPKNRLPVCVWHDKTELSSQPAPAWLRDLVLVLSDPEAALYPLLGASLGVCHHWERETEEWRPSLLSPPSGQQQAGLSCCVTLYLHCHCWLSSPTDNTKCKHGNIYISAFLFTNNFPLDFSWPFLKFDISLSLAIWLVLIASLDVLIKSNASLIWFAYCFSWIILETWLKLEMKSHYTNCR